MSFKHYRIILRLLSPLHIGKRKYRNLMETREYVPGRTLWGALTARITRDYFNSRPNFYEKIGKFLHQNFRFGYLWPSLDRENPYFPWVHNDFDYLFKFGYIGQPIETDRKATEEGQLHESEFIGPVTRDNREVYLVGDLWIKSDILVDESEKVVCLEGRNVLLGKVFSNLQLGGEKGYGWGRVKFEDIIPVNGRKAIGDVQIIPHSEKVILEFAKGQHLTAHALAAEWNSPSDGILSPISNGKIRGLIEPLTGYEYKGKYSPIANPPICYVPGSKCTINTRLEVGVFGLLVNYEHESSS